MRQSCFAEMIGWGLRDLYDVVVTEPLSKRLVDLINRLDEQDGNPIPSCTRPTKRRM
jgi:Anti-sigma factor NepR